MLATISGAYDAIKKLLADLDLYGMGFEVENDLKNTIHKVDEALLTVMGDRGTWAQSPGGTIGAAQVDEFDCKTTTLQGSTGAAALYKVSNNEGFWKAIGIFAYVTFGADGTDMYGLMLPPADDPTNMSFWKHFKDTGATSDVAMDYSAGRLNMPDLGGALFTLSDGQPYDFGFNVHVSTARVVKNQRVLTFSFQEPAPA